MGNRPFIIPIQKTREVPESFEWGDLKNKFSGKSLFRSKLYYLETGDLSALDIIENKWFYLDLVDYARSKQDFNLLPALKKIAGSLRFDESLRQSASEAAEMIEEQWLKKKDLPKIIPAGSEYEKSENARKILAGTRYPQTTEVLKLLREKSPELKRLALYLIGNFKLTDMIQEVCECLNISGIQEDAYDVLLSFGSTANKEINRYYLTASGNINTRKTILRLMTKINKNGDISFLTEQLWSSSRQIKEMVVDILLSSKYRVNKEESYRLKKQISEVFGNITWIIAAQVALMNNNDTVISAEINKEYFRWKNYLRNLLILTYNNSSIPEDIKVLKEEKDDPGRYTPEIADILFDKVKPESADISDPGYFKKKLKRLQRYFPCEVPEYKSLLDDIINCDYNLLSIWTKACTLRSIREIGDEELGESAVALLFSPEGILCEEASRLIARSDRKLYRNTSERIPEITRKHLDRIISDDIMDRELIFEKVRFLCSCFKNVNEDEMLFLAGRTNFIRNDDTGMFSQPTDTILWSFPDMKSDPQVFVNHEDNTDPGKVVKDIRNKFIFCYFLPMNAIREFCFLFPERAFGIFKYIDKCENNS